MSDCCSAPGLMAVEEGLDRMRQVIRPVDAQEMVSLPEALDRVLAIDIVSPLNVPPCDNSAMDGYALRAADLAAGTPLPVAGKSFAGHPFTDECPSGHCIRIMTGASIPAGTDTVIMQEQTEQTDTGIRFLTDSQPGNNIREAGEDIREGHTVLSAGRRLRPQDIGLLASLGIARVKVLRKLKVAIFSTGDELRQPGETLNPGDIYDSNRHTVHALLQRLGVEVLDLGCIPDDCDQLREAFLTADREADAVITSGGVSVGEADYTKTILDELGKTEFWKLAIKPGKPFAFGTLPNSLFFGLPGNPVSATVTFDLLVAPMLQVMMGAGVYVPRQLLARSREILKKRAGRREYLRGILHTGNDGVVEVSTTGRQGSGILTSMSQADCYIIFPEDQTLVEKHAWVSVQLFDAPLC